MRSRTSRTWKTTTPTWKSVTTGAGSPTPPIRSAVCRETISSAPPRSIGCRNDPAVGACLQEGGNVAAQPERALRELPFEERQLAHRIESGGAQPRERRIGVRKQPLQTVE